MKSHNVKCIQPFFGLIETGQKNYECRIDDRNYQEGDLIVLQEYDSEKKTYSGKVMFFTVGYILRGPIYGVKDGWVIFSLIKP